MSGSIPVGGAEWFEELPVRYDDDDLPEYTPEQWDEMDQLEAERRESEWDRLQRDFKKAQAEGFAGDIWAFEKELRSKMVADMRNQVANQPQNLIKQLQDIGSVLKREQHPLAGDLLRLVQPLRDVVDAHVAPQRQTIDADHELMAEAAEAIRQGRAAKADKLLRQLAHEDNPECAKCGSPLNFGGGKGRPRKYCIACNPPRSAKRT